MKTPRPKALLLVALLITASLGSTAALAAEAAADEDEVPAETQAGDASAEPSSEVFIPTEEISEDFAVSFPVDI